MIDDEVKLKPILTISVTDFGDFIVSNVNENDEAWTWGSAPHLHSVGFMVGMALRSILGLPEKIEEEGITFSTEADALSFLKDKPDDPFVTSPEGVREREALRRFWAVN